MSADELWSEDVRRETQKGDALRGNDRKTHKKNEYGLNMHWNGRERRNHVVLIHAKNKTESLEVLNS